jgi:hypothetical protein
MLIHVLYGELILEISFKKRSKCHRIMVERERAIYIPIVDGLIGQHKTMSS